METEASLISHSFLLSRSDQSTAIIENTNTEDMHSFVVPYTSTMKTATDANKHITTVDRFSLNEKLVDEVDASERIIPRPHEVVVEKDAATFQVNGVLITNIVLLGDLQIGAMDLLQKLGVVETNSGDPHTVTLIVGSLPNAISISNIYLCIYILCRCIK